MACKLFQHTTTGINRAILYIYVICCHKQLYTFTVYLAEQNPHTTAAAAGTINISRQLIIKYQQLAKLAAINK